MSYTTTTTRPSTILYIDDDSDDCLILKSSLEDCGNSANLIFANDGEEAVRYLNSVSPASLPNLIVLDLNMPRWDGKQTLRYLKSQPHLASIPVVVLSTSINETDINACASLGAASYFSKPFHYDGYKNMIADFSRYMKAC
ncbi:MAG TPA: response regulator [Flavisolibacter sp.]|nr:response regulator [Flavisolibacter sp.]